MDPPTQDDNPLSSPELSTASSISISIPASNYLTVPSTRPPGTSFSLPGPTTFKDDDPDLLIPASPASLLDNAPRIFEPPCLNPPTRRLSPFASSIDNSGSSSDLGFMSVSSTSSVESEYSTYSNP